MNRTVNVGDVVRLNASTLDEVLVVSVEKDSVGNEHSFLFTVIPYDDSGRIVEPEHSTYALWASSSTVGIEVLTLRNIQFVFTVTFKKHNKTYTIKQPKG